MRSENSDDVPKEKPLTALANAAHISSAVFDFQIATIDARDPTRGLGDGCPGPLAPTRSVWGLNRCSSMLNVTRIFARHAGSDQRAYECPRCDYEVTETVQFRKAG